MTTIIGGGIPKPALIGWAAKMTALYAIQNLELIGAHVNKDRDDNGNLPKFSEDDGKPVSDGCMEAYDLLTKARYRSAGKKADLGSEIHECIEAWNLDKPLPEWGPEIEPYMVQFLEWLSTFEPKVIASEVSVYNRTYRYAGTLDMMVELDVPALEKGLWIVDVKTGGVWPEQALQQAAYAHAEFVGLPNGDENPMPGPIVGAAILDLKPNEVKFIPVDIGDNTLNSFLYAREVFRWQEEYSKDAIGAPVSWPATVAEEVNA